MQAQYTDIVAVVTATNPLNLRELDFSTTHERVHMWGSFMRGDLISARLCSNGNVTGTLHTHIYHRDIVHDLFRRTDLAGVPRQLDLAERLLSRARMDNKRTGLQNDVYAIESQLFLNDVPMRLSNYFALLLELDAAKLFPQGEPCDALMRTYYQLFRQCSRLHI